MAKKRQLLRKEVTYSEVKDEELNLLHQLGYHAQQTTFFAHLSNKREWIRDVVSHHLGLRSRAECVVAEPKDWLHGSFNVCIPVKISCWQAKRVLMRFPLPYRVGEAFNPGNCDEKIRCEAASYAWLEKNCPNIPTPKCYGFALSSGEMFTRCEMVSWFSRYFLVLRRQFLSWMWKLASSNYIRHQSTSLDLRDSIGTGYLLLEFIEADRGSMLSTSWEEGRHNPKLRSHLFSDLTRTFLDLIQFPLPSIGSLQINNHGLLTLCNRPLSMEIHQLENEGIPTDIPRNFTYSTVDSYITDVLGLHDNRFRYQPNAVNNMGDCAYQLSVLTAMRTIFQSIFSRSFRRGPYFLTFTDLHQSNIFVDPEWHITCILDLEWMCALPIEMCGPPYWLTNKGVDELDPAEYDSIREEFMQSLSIQEEKLDPGISTFSQMGKEAAPPIHLSDVMDKSWKSGAFWYTLALSSPSGLFSIFTKHLRPLFCNAYEDEFETVMPFFFEKKVGSIAGRKLADKKEYDQNLRRAFDLET